MEHASKTVVVVGAGLAGLSTAYRLVSLKQKVILCDAWQVGGRTKSIVLGGSDHISVGGMCHVFFLCPSLFLFFSTVN